MLPFLWAWGAGNRVLEPQAGSCWRVRALRCPLFPSGGQGWGGGGRGPRGWGARDHVLEDGELREMPVGTWEGFTPTHGSWQG